MPRRRTREETWADWEEDVPTDDPEGWELTIFKSGYEDADFSCRTLPRTYIGRSLLERVSFHNTDLHDSHLCWNDFVDVDFSDAVLRSSDLRASLYRRCNFRNCCLTGADLRQSEFENCAFAGADLRGTKVTYAQASRLVLSPEQTATVDWQNQDGPEPEGG